MAGGSSSALPLLAALAVVGAACEGDAPAPADASPEALEPWTRHELQSRAVHIIERGRRAAGHGARRAARTGANPYRIARVPGSRRLVGLLRGDDAVVLLGDDGRELARAPAPPSPTDLAFSWSGELFVVGEGGGGIARYRAGDASSPSLERVGEIPVEGAVSLRSIVTSGPWAFVADSYRGEIRGLQTTAGEAARQHRVGDCLGPVDLQIAGSRLVASCLLDRSLVGWRVGAGEPADEPAFRIEHDGPMWSVAAAPRWDPETGAHRGLLVAAGGVENRPLDRVHGGFGHVDSFVFLYAVPEGDDPEQLAAVNVSALGVVTPKWVDLQQGRDGSVRVDVTGYGSDRRAALTWPSGETGAPPGVERFPALPGARDAARAPPGIVVANPLLDGWVIARGAAPALVRVTSPGDEHRTAMQRVGEALAFTTLMAPYSESRGRRSRFTCETCHHEGYGDGRTHYTGRGEVHATTKPIRGLFENRPHFTRALDETTAEMVQNEFRAANQLSGRDPWFSLRTADVGWLEHVPGVPERLSPVFLRRSLMAFFATFEHEPNPRARRREAFTELERRGARVFLDRCERCHSARLVTDDRDSRVPFADWERHVLSERAPIVWASARYRRTGIDPPVHPRGARPTSLRRLYRKRPYFTSGSAPDLDAVLERAAEDGDRFFHEGAPEGARRLSGDERAALRAFLALL